MREYRIEKSRGRYWLIGILFFHTINTYMDRACISSASGAIQRDLNIDDMTMGYIFGIFAIGYALFQIPSGWLADVLGPRKVLACVVSLWSVFTVLTGTAFNAVSLPMSRCPILPSRRGPPTHSLSSRRSSMFWPPSRGFS